MPHDPRIRLTGHIDVPANRLDVVARALPDHIALTRAEAGCLSFEVAPDPAIAGRFTVTELFTGRAAFDAHQTRTRASRWARITDGIPRSYSIEEIEA